MLDGLGMGESVTEIDEVISGTRKWCVVEADAGEVLADVGHVDAVVTDPPYGIGEAAGRNKTRTRLAVSKDFGDDAWDDEPAPQALIDRLRGASEYQVIFGGNYYALPASSCWLVWDKLNGSNDFADCELAWTNLPKAVRRIQHRWAGMLRDSDDERIHPTQKPVAVMRWAIGHLPESVSVILDPFAGSGTTGVAAMLAGKRAILIEREPRWAAQCRARMTAEMTEIALHGPQVQIKICSGCRRPLLVTPETFNRKTQSVDGLQPYCRECDFRQKHEPEKSWKAFVRCLKARSLGEERVWSADVYFRTIGDRLCHYCKGDVSSWSGGYWLDKIDPAGRYEPANCVPCCWPCNCVKSNRPEAVFREDLSPLLAEFGPGKVPWGARYPTRFKRVEPPNLSAYVRSPQLSLARLA